MAIAILLEKNNIFRETTTKKKHDGVPNNHHHGSGNSETHGWLSLVTMVNLFLFLHHEHALIFSVFLDKISHITIQILHFKSFPSS